MHISAGWIYICFHVGIFTFDHVLNLDATHRGHAVSAHILIIRRSVALNRPIPLHARLSGVQAATYSYVMEFHRGSQRNVSVSFVTMFMPAVYIFLPVLAWFIIPMNWEVLIFGLKFTPWRLFLICSSMLNVMNFIFMLLLPESPKFLLSMDKKEETLEVLRTMYRINSGERKEVPSSYYFKYSNFLDKLLITLLFLIGQMFPVERLESEATGRNIADVKGIGGMFRLIWHQTWPLFVKPHLGPTLKLCYLMFILFSIGHGTLMWYLASKQKAGLSDLIETIVVDCRYPDFLSQLELHIGEGLTLCEVLNVPKLIVQNETTG